MAARIVREEGVRSLYRGVLAASLRELSYSSLRFGLYEPIKKTLGATDPKNTPFYKKVLAGLSAGSFAAAVASPTDLLKIRAQGETGIPRSLSVHATEIAYANGATSFFQIFANFYRGVSTTVIRAGLIGATKMATYDETKHRLRMYLGWRDEIAIERYSLQFCASVSAGLALSLTSSPATNARTIIMTSPPGTYSGFTHAIISIIQSRGILGLYRGFAAQWARVAPYALVQFFVWEQLRRVVGMRPL
eukprot:CAMPEP_0197317602 /NCGR_PEP_ID=MMETSP0891-20130614/47712_1 /TAXON_ID=44058 ORGANISM="Aureoumbra lagunensis, Strain CCMP1510" /NCGR_SAMPLE_ID=MMETSP0891 /ASSEMBLY_ACC=CAM_ASM_000534 /LENGTH=247 /DNA_ID=CAMNT_0042807663 /DNA_START=130 /DNA_END=873 /DNA_ORIENTATION=+